MDDISLGIENIPVSLVHSDDANEIPQFEYVSTNVPGPSIATDDFEFVYCGCKCSNECLSDCSCILRFGHNYTEDGCLLTDTFRKYDRLIAECNTLCKCSAKCSNRVVQHGLRFNLQVFKTVDKGFGVKTLDFIKKSKFVCEYAGEVLTKHEALNRFSLLKPGDSNYIIVVNEYIGEKKQFETIVDPTYVGNLGRFLNHSCSPNLFMVPIRTDCLIPKLCLFASRDIDPLEELCYDYSGGLSSYRQDDILEYNQNAIKKCMCNSESCKGILPYDPFVLK